MNRKRMQGVYVVEFAIIGLLLFTLLFGVLEMGRLYFTVGTLNEVARRGARLAAVCDISDPVVLRRAIFNAATDSGASDLISSLETADLSLTYLDENGAIVANPNDNGSGFSSVRYVQLSIVNFSFTLLIPGFGGGITLPAFRATLPRESLGRHAEAGVVPEITPC
ncbi:TadE/TadG family type IV pilus assembly protein [Pseudomonas sp.]|uniref:TadE/TadG family type IV pilus assembly protein n=1 Tax=Pseudomonas sp. TaxID=306 RepID=UPI00273571B8|nr:TadE/TadG family type IV pilus assembly protein [Pseudomonas sp.]MDP3816040.1 TadE/TadG family type IV pilus assembly protein [Pseudomonas sp.]